MPYFQRAPVGGPPAHAARGRGGEVSPLGIVEKASSVLATSLAVTPAAPVEALGGSLGPLAGPAALGDLQSRAGELLAALLEVVARSGQLAPLERATGASIPAAASLANVTSTIPVISPSCAAKAGETIKLTLPFANEGAGLASLTPFTTDFISNSGHEIPSFQVTFSPRVLTLGAGAPGMAEMQVAIPAQSGPGKYSALVQATGLDGPRAVVVLEVE
jgi:hypothetical protein